MIEGTAGADSPPRTINPKGAFLRLTVNPVRGVLAWEEVDYGGLPEAVRSHYTAPAEG